MTSYKMEYVASVLQLLKILYF